jgi:hypothetical protein
MRIGTVIYLDIYDVSCNDVKQVAKALHLTLDHVICGEIDDLVQYLNDHSIAIHAITSFDVIEHVYDVDAFMQSMGQLRHSSLRIVHASGANIRNPLYVYETVRMQKEMETRDRPMIWGTKERDTLKSYFSVRLEIIQQCAPDLSASEAEKLAHLTRGLQKDDIQRAVEEYKSRGQIRYRPDHPTNTCDPNTGNWAEHLMHTDRFEPILKRQGFQVQILSGYRGHFKQKIFNLALPLINGLISLLGFHAMPISPYYIVYGEKE